MTKSDKKCPIVQARTLEGALISDLVTAPTITPHGPGIMESQVMETIQRFTREKIPERVVHAKGGAAFGTFTCKSNLISKVCDAKLFKLNEKTKIVVRFSTVLGAKGSADSVRSSRGFAVRFYTKDGNWDLLACDQPMFFVRDPALFPSFINSQSMSRDGLPNATIKWDFLTSVPETFFATLFVFSTRGIPFNFRFMDGFGVNTFMFHKGNKVTAVRFRFKSCQGIKNLSSTEAIKLAGIDPDSSVRDLRDSINKGKFPSWTLNVQLVTYSKKIAKLDPRIVYIDDFDPILIIDPTKIWPTTTVPEIEIGKIVLNENPFDTFAQVEQLAFNGANFVHGIGPSNDRVLSMRLFIYRDAQLYRIGTNFNELEVNKPIVKSLNFNINGSMAKPADTPVYYPNTLCPFATYLVELGEKPTNIPYPNVLEQNKVKMGYFNNSNQDNFSQATTYYLTLNFDERKYLAKNLADDLQLVLDCKIVHKALHILKEIHPNLKDSVEAYLEGKKPPIYPKILKHSGFEFLTSNGH